MKIQNPKTRWIIDAVLLIATTLTYFLELSGLTLHQLLGILSAILAAYHLLIHWDWVKSVVSRLWMKTSSKSRLYFGMDLGLFIGVVVIIVTGLMISSWLNLPLANEHTWLKIHVLASIGSLALLAIKITVHWRWIAQTGRKILIRPVRLSGLSATGVSSSNQNQMSRREFLRVALPASAVTLAASGMAIRSLARLNMDDASSGSSYAYAQELSTPTAFSSAANQTSLTATSTPATTVEPGVASPTRAVSTQVPAANACKVRCNRGCSYPGRCRRYTDSNNNSRCDLGECM